LRSKDNPAQSVHGMTTEKVSTEIHLLVDGLQTDLVAGIAQQALGKI